MANNAGTFFNVNDNDGIPLVGVSTDGRVLLNHLYGNCLIGSTSATGTASQPLQVTGGAYVSGSLGIGITNPSVKLNVIGDSNFTGVVTASSFVGNLTGAATTLADAANITTGTISSSRLSGSYGISITGTANTLSNAANITTGTISSSRLSGTYGISITGTATTATNLTDAANITTGTISSSRLSGSYGINITGTATTATNLTDAANITTGTISSSRLSGTYGISITGTATNVIGGISSVTQLSVSGITTTTTLNVGTGGTVITTTSSGLVGIGTTNPQGILQVGAGTSTFIVTGIGSVGIGSILPQKSLDILGANNSFIRIGKVDGLPVNAIWLNDLTTSSTTWNFGSGISPATTTLINSPPGSETRFYSGGDLKHKIDQYGNFNVGAGLSTGTASQPLQVTGGAAFYGTGSNVGIGTTNPTSKLHVIGDARVGIDTSQGVILTSPNGTKFRLFVSNTGVLSTVLVP